MLTNQQLSIQFLQYQANKNASSSEKEPCLQESFYSYNTLLQLAQFSLFFFLLLEISYIDFFTTSMVSLNVFLLVLALFFLTQQQQVSSKLVLIQSIISHGAKHPQGILGIGDDYALKEHSLGQLTTQGKVMHYNLGKKMYEVYWKRLFGGTKYQNVYHPSRFYIQSTDENRTIESAQSHLYGILQSVNPLILSTNQAQFANPPYPKAHAVPGPVYGSSGPYVHPVPVHIYGRNISAFDNGDFLARFLQCECPNQHTWQTENLENDKYQKMMKNESYVKSVAQLSKVLGKSLDTKNFLAYYSSLLCMQSYGKPVPDIFSQPSETKRALESLYTLNSFVKFYGGEKQIRASANDLINKTITNMQKAMKNIELSEQWVVYSAHDITIGIVLGVLNLWDADCIYNAFKDNIEHSEDCIIQFPRFASSFVFQLYKSLDGSKYTYKINYNGEHRKIPFCDNKQECEFQRLLQWYESWKVDDIKAACGAPNYYTKEILILLSTAIIVSLIYALVLRIVRGNEESKKQ